MGESKEINVTKVMDIEGIGSTYAQKLQEIGIHTTEALLKRGAAKRGRQEIAQMTGISEVLVLEWVNLADLARIRGIGSEYSDLIEEAGVDTVKELRNRRPENLFAAMQKVNQEKKLVRRLPALRQVTAWIEQAGNLPPMVSY